MLQMRQDRILSCAYVWPVEPGSFDAIHNAVRLGDGAFGSLILVYRIWEASSP